MQIASVTILAVLPLAMLAPIAFADEVCAQGELTRTVRIVYADPGQAVPCEVLYEKSQEGGTQTLWRARNEAGYCEARAKEFVEKLKTMGWSCTTQQAPPQAD